MVTEFFFNGAYATDKMAEYPLWHFFCMCTL